MNRYALKINDSTYIKQIHWIAGYIPQITTSDFQNSMIVTDEYLNFEVDFEKSRLKAIKLHYPNIKIVKVKLVIDES